MNCIPFTCNLQSFLRVGPNISLGPRTSAAGIDTPLPHPLPVPSETIVTWLTFALYPQLNSQNPPMLLLRELQRFDSATDRLECQTGQVYLRSGLGHITVHEQFLALGRAQECTKICISRSKNNKPDPTPTRHNFGSSILAPSALDLAPSKSKSWIRPCVW